MKVRMEERMEERIEERMVILTMDTLDPSIPASTPDTARGVLTLDTDTGWLMDMDTLDHTVLTIRGDTTCLLDTESIRLTLDTVDSLSISPVSTLDSPTAQDTADMEDMVTFIRRSSHC